MFNSELFKTEVRPYFSEQYQCSLSVIGPDLTKRTVDVLDLTKLAQRESILVLALCQTTKMREETQLEKKEKLQKELKKKFKKLGSEESETSMNLMIQIDTKKRKISILQEYIDLLKTKI
jgi:hypothetical protein